MLRCPSSSLRSATTPTVQHPPSTIRRPDPPKDRRSTSTPSGTSSAGGSLRLWRDYFARSTILGVDVQPKVLDLGDRVRFVQADQSRRCELDRVLETAGRRPDVVIDDGSHVGEHVRTTFDVLFP